MVAPVPDEPGAASGDDGPVTASHLAVFQQPALLGFHDIGAQEAVRGTDIEVFCNLYPQKGFDVRIPRCVLLFHIGLGTDAVENSREIAERQLVYEQ